MNVIKNMQKHFGKAQCGQRGISTLVGIIIIVIVAVILFGGVFAYQYFTKSQNPISNAQPNPNSQDASVPAGNTETNSSPAQNQQATEGWKTYRNDEYGFEFRYPSNFNIDEKNENGITLSDYERGKENFDESQRYISIKATGIPLNSQNKNTTPVLQESCIGNKKENPLLFKENFVNPNGTNFSYYANYPENISAFCMPEGCAYQDNYRTFYSNICLSILFLRNDMAYVEDKNQNLGNFKQILSTFKFTK